MIYDKFKQVYFLGIGGMGMSSLAQYFLDKESGCKVFGYDQNQSAVIEMLSREGAIIHDTETDLPEEVVQMPDQTLVVYTPAFSKHHKLYKYLFDNGYTMKSRSSILRSICKDKQVLAVAGTHGKTTTTALIAHILFQSKIPMWAFVGGVIDNYETNLIRNCSFDQAKWLVVEADEFNRSFLDLFPAIGVITSMEYDHPETYPDFDAMKTAFCTWMGQCSTLLVQSHAAESLEIKNCQNQVDTYGVTKGNFTALNRVREVDCTFFDYCCGEKTEAVRLKLALIGDYNLENSLAAVAVCQKIGLSLDQISKGLRTFPGVKRRCKVNFSSENLVYVDDYAHHPGEISAVLMSLKNLYNGYKILAIFEPHLFSRTMELKRDFAESLSHSDEVWLLPIFPAREEPVEEVTSDIILRHLSVPAKSLATDELIGTISEYLKGSEVKHLLITMGAGSIGKLGTEITKLLETLN